MMILQIFFFNKKWFFFSFSHFSPLFQFNFFKYRLEPIFVIKNMEGVVNNGAGMKFTDLRIRLLLLLLLCWGVFWQVGWHAAAAHKSEFDKSSNLYTIDMTRNLNVNSPLNMIILNNISLLEQRLILVKHWCLFMYNLFWSEINSNKVMCTLV